MVGQMLDRQPRAKRKALNGTKVLSFLGKAGIPALNKKKVIKILRPSLTVHTVPESAVSLILIPLARSQASPPSPLRYSLLWDAPSSCFIVIFPCTRIRVSHQAAKLKMALGRSQTLPLPQFLYAKVRNLDPELVKRLLSASQLFF